MNRDDVLAKLKGAEAELRSRGVAHAALFGSLARGEAGPGSDIDVMVELTDDAQVGLFEYIGIIQVIEDMFPTRVDVANRRQLKPYVRPSAERDAAETRVRLTTELMAARRAIMIGRKHADAVGVAAARAAVDAAKVALGERGPVWWDDGAPDLNRRMARNTSYAIWFADIDAPGV